MDQLKAMRVFAVVAEAEGFAPAAKRLGMSPPAVTRAVAALEREAGTPLLKRTTRVVRLTEAGAALLADCRRILADVDEALTAAAGVQIEPRGALSVTAPAMFGRLHVAPIVLEFLDRHPETAVRTLLVDRVVDLLEEGIDTAVRIAHLPDSSLRAVRVGSVRRVVCAAPEYLARSGVPRRPGDLAAMETVYFGGAAQWRFKDANGRVRAVKPPSRLTVNTAELAVAAAVAGRGLARLFSYQVAAELAAGRLELVLEDWEPEPFPVHLVHAEGRRVSARLRAFIDLAVERLRALPALSQPG